MTSKWLTHLNSPSQLTEFFNWNDTTLNDRIGGNRPTSQGRSFTMGVRKGARGTRPPPAKFPHWKFLSLTVQNFGNQIVQHVIRVSGDFARRPHPEIPAAGDGSPSFVSPSETNCGLRPSSLPSHLPSYLGSQTSKASPLVTFRVGYTFTSQHLLRSTSPPETSCSIVMIVPSCKTCSISRA